VSGRWQLYSPLVLAPHEQETTPNLRYPEIRRCDNLRPNLVTLSLQTGHEPLEQHSIIDTREIWNILEEQSFWFEFSGQPKKIEN
jgi:hypothetical protein